MVKGLGFRVLDLGFRIRGLGLDFKFWLQGLRIGV
jgi:hypothetical protein